MTSEKPSKQRFLVCLPPQGPPNAGDQSPRTPTAEGPQHVAFALAQKNQLWPRAAGGPIVLRVGFFEHPDFGQDQRTFVKGLITDRWRSATNGLIEFDWLEETLEYTNEPAEVAKLQAKADVRVLYNPVNGPSGGSYSLVGVDCIRVTGYVHTMQFGWDVESDEAMPVHEFGHVLGLMHEQQSPFEGRIVFDREKYIDYLMQHNPSWDRPTAEHQVEELTKQGLVGTPYDEHSVMHYQIPSYLIEGFEIKGQVHRRDDPKVADKLSGDEFPSTRPAFPSTRDLKSINSFMPPASDLKQLSENGAQVKAIVYDDSKGGVFAFTNTLNKLDTSTGALAPVNSTDWKAATAAVLIPGSGQAFVAAAHLFTVTLENGAATQRSNEDFTGTRFLLHDEPHDEYYAIGRNIRRLTQGASVIVGDASINWSATQAAAAIGGYAYIVNQGQLLKLELPSGAAVLLNSEPWVAGVKALVNYNSMLIAIADNVYLVNTRTGRNYLIRDDSNSGLPLWSGTTAACAGVVDVYAACGRIYHFTVPGAYKRIQS